MLTIAYDVSGHYRTACTSYEPQGIFPYAIRNQLAHTTLFDYDRGLGVLWGTVDPNGLATRLRHDGFGRLTEELHPDGSSATSWLSREKKGGPTGDWWALEVKTAIGGGPQSTRELDSLGRPVHAWAHVADTRACDGPHCVTMLRLEQATTYDHFGRMTRATAPWMEGDSLTGKYADSYDYDAIGRVTEHVEPWGRKTTYTYGGNKVTATDWLGSTTREVDALGRTVKTTDKAKGAVETQYGPFSQPFTVTRFGNEKTTTHRDAYGRVIEEDDPDRGTTSTHYDGFGEVLTVDDAAARHFAFTYDEIGRLAERDDTVNGTTSTTTLAYDSAPHGVGKIAQVTSPDGHVDAYTYTHLSQPHTHTLTFGDTGESFSSTLSYDKLGRVLVVEYPHPREIDPLAVRREHDDFGNVVALRDEATAATYWKLEELDGAGRPTKEVLGNGVTVRHTYAPDSGVVGHVEAVGPGFPHTPPLQGLEYEYDVGLRMTSRTDELQHGLLGPLSESFGYDAIDRLTCINSGLLLRGCASPIEYAPNGNIKTKDGLAYTYDPAHPHAVKTVGAGSYQHDAVGNQIDRPGATIAYTPFDLPESYTFTGDANVVQPIATTQFAYDGGQHRIRKTLRTPAGATLRETAYLDELYERVRDESGERHLFYVGAGSATVVLTRAEHGNDDVAYALNDALGSVDVITDGGGKVIEKRSYDAFGARRDPAGWVPWQGPLASDVTTVGFEGLEADDEAGLVNMRGRIYDPKIGRFLSTDPLVSRPGFGQSWNPYSYVLNSPLDFMDPSGFEDTPAGPNRQPLLPSQPMPGCGTNMSCKVVKAEPPQQVNACTAQAVTVAKDGVRDDAVAKTVTVNNEPGFAQGPTIGAAPPPPTTDPRYPNPKYRFLEGAAAPPPSSVPIVSPQGVVGMVSTQTSDGTWRVETFPEYPGYSISVKEPDTKKVEVFATITMAVVPVGVEMLALRGGATALAAEPALAKAGEEALGTAEGVGAWPASKPFLDTNPKSVPTWGHTFLRHGEGAKIARNLIGRAANTGDAQGQWLSNQAAAEWLAGQRPYIQGPASTVLPPGMGEVILPNGTTIPATHVTLIPDSSGGLVTAFPTQ